MKRLMRFCYLFASGLKTLWGCEANIFLKLAALPVMILIVIGCCILDLIDKPE